jgi:hypothetical protein
MFAGLPYIEIAADNGEAPSHGGVFNELYHWNGCAGHIAYSIPSKINANV